MDFSFSDEQLELRQTVRQALARAFPVRALRAFNEAAPDVRSTMAASRWTMLAQLGATGAR